MKSVFAFAALFVAYAAAQSTTGSAAPPTGTAGIPTCVLACSTQAATTAGCTGITDTACVCGSTDFQTAALGCLQQQCPDEIAAATALQQQMCGASGSGSASEPAGTATGTVSSAPAAGTATAPASSRPVTSGAATTRAVSSSASASASASAGATNGASSFNFAATSAWAAAALGGVAVAQLVL